jgi:hypothetical protein
MTDGHEFLVTLFCDPSGLQKFGGLQFAGNNF